MDNIAKENFWNKKRLIWVVFAILFLVFVLVMYKAGYRIKNNLTIGKIGTVTIETPLPLTYIYIDESKKITTTKDNEKTILNFSPRKHSVIISRDGYFPWKKEFMVPSNGNIELKPFFISQNASGEIITTKDPEYYNIRNKVVKNILPSKNSPKKSLDSKTILWLEDNAIMMQTGSTTTMVLQPDTIIGNVDFYKNRDDIVIFSTSNSVYAIEKDKEGGQNFMPIYKGQEPNFIVNNENSLYILDGSNLMVVII